ncbi:hypothetical protein O5D80_007284 [Batrachochytrium dendrobatidis]|nr:hypothetical protein O5D80_007284 [Batrachochytrium dendrobatidis]
MFDNNPILLQKTDQNNTKMEQLVCVFDNNPNMNNSWQLLDIRMNEIVKSKFDQNSTLLILSNMKWIDVMKELIKHLEDLKLLTTDAQLYKADEIWDRLLVLILELKEHNYRSTDALQRLQSIELQDIITKYLEYNRPSLQVKVMEFTKVFLSIVHYDDQFKISHRLSNQIVQLMQSPSRQVKMMAINTCT